MPRSEYFKGKGEAVWADMIRRYGQKEGAQVFYAVANERGLTPPKKKKARRKR